MDKIRRLSAMIAGVCVLCSSSLPWIDGASPGDVGIGRIITDFISFISGGNAVISFGILDQVAVSAILFLLGIVILASAVLSSRKLAVIGGLLTILVVLMWLLPTGIGLASIVNGFGALGIGTDLAIIGGMADLVCVILAH